MYHKYTHYAQFYTILFHLTNPYRKCYLPFMTQSFISKLQVNQYGKQSKAIISFKNFTTISREILSLTPTSIIAFTLPN